MQTAAYVAASLEEAEIEINYLASDFNNGLNKDFMSYQKFEENPLK